MKSESFFSTPFKFSIKDTGKQVCEHKLLWFIQNTLSTLSIYQVSTMYLPTKLGLTMRSEKQIITSPFTF